MHFCRSLRGRKLGRAFEEKHEPAAAKTDEYPPTETMNRVAGEKATSSQDTQRQQQGQPTAAQQAQGAEPSAKMTDDNQPRVSQPTQGAQPSEKMAEQDC